MRIRVVALSLALLCTAATDSHEPTTRFLLPRNGVLLYQEGRSQYVHAQWYISRHKDNRSYVVSCRGACHWTAGPDSMEGESHEAIMPRQPVRVEIDGAGEALFTLSVFGAGGKLRETAEARLRVCGGEPPCDQAPGTPLSARWLP